MNSISLKETSEFDDQFYMDYSRFKHGSKSIARKFGKMCSKLFNSLELDNQTVVIYSAPYLNIPTASNAFKDYMLSYSSNIFEEKNINVKQGYINRLYSYDDDYGLMSREQRDKAISSDIFHIDKNFISPNDILIFIDDIKITGSHERRMIELIEREKITNNVNFFYLANYTGDEPIIENKLNHYSVSTLRDINDIIRNDEFIFNTRVVKFILKADIEHFVSFITYQSDVFINTLYSLSVLNNYHKNNKYKNNFSILKSLL